MLNRRGGRAGQLVDRLIKDAGIQIEHFTTQHLELARETYARYGNGHRFAAALQGERFLENGFGYGIAQRASKESSPTLFAASC